MTSVWTRVCLLGREFLCFGIGVLLRYPAKLFKKPYVRMRIKGIGPVYIRPGESDLSAFSQVFVDESYDISRFTQHRLLVTSYELILRAGCIPVIDAGANAGAASLWFARLFPEAKILAIEPNPGVIPVLKQNVALHPNIVIVEAVVGCGSGARSDRFDPRPGVGARSSRAEEGVAVLTIADLLARFPRGKIFIAKIDIEGFEKDLFTANTAWVDEVACIFIELHDWLFPEERGSRSFQRAVLGKDFDILIAGGDIGRS